MQHFPTYFKRSRFSSPATAFFVALFSVFFGVENGLAKTWYWRSLYFVTYPGSVQTTGTVQRRVITSNGSASTYEVWPFLANLRIYSSGNLIYYYDPQYNPPVLGVSNPAPYYYTPGPSGSFEVPDSYPDYMLDEINKAYNKLSPNQQAAITGAPICGISTLPDGTSQNWYYFQHRAIGSLNSAGGVFTYGPDGIPEISFPDNSGYASGYKQLPDGSFTPVYYSIDNGTVTEFSNIPTPSYDSLQYDSDLGHYTLNIPDYHSQLDKIINKLDSVKSSSDVTVNPDVTVNVDSPDLSNLEQSISGIQSTLDDILTTQVSDYPPPMALSTNDFELTSEEQNIITNYRYWETNIPLLGNTLDFGLNTLLGRIPAIGSEYTWLDYTIGSAKSTRSLPSNPLQGFRIFISLDRYRDLLLALRGCLILFEALYFIILTYRNIREALKV